MPTATIGKGKTKTKTAKVAKTAKAQVSTPTPPRAAHTQLLSDVIAAARAAQFENEAISESKPSTTKMSAISTPRKPLDLSTAHVADGSLDSPRSLYDIIGGPRNAYGNTRDFATYQNKLRSMELFQLQRHAKDVAVLPSQTKETTIKRLEDKFLLEQHKNRRVEPEEKEPTEQDAIRERAEAIMSGRIRSGGRVMR